MYGEGKKGGVIKDLTFTTYSNDGLAKNKKILIKNLKNIIRLLCRKQRMKKLKQC